MPTPNILVIGSSNADLIIKMDKLPGIGETVTDGQFLQTFGGKGANQAVAAARAGGKVTFVNCIGDDAFGTQLIENFKKDGIRTDFIFKEKDVPSGTALIMVDSNGDNYLSVAPGANYRLSRTHIDQVRSAIQQADLILLQYEIPEDTLIYILEMAQAARRKVILNLAPARPFPTKYLQMLYLLVVNEKEAEFFSGQRINTSPQVEIAAEKLFRLSPSGVIVTLGEQGSFVMTPAFRDHFSAMEVQAVDTTAAGDVFCGALAVALVEGKSLRQAVEFANVAAGISVTRLGAQLSAPYRREIDHHLARKKP